MITEARERANLYHVQLALRRDRIVANVHADDAADDDMMHLVERVPGQRKRAMEFTFQMHRRGRNPWRADESARHHFKARERSFVNPGREKTGRDIDGLP